MNIWIERVGCAGTSKWMAVNRDAAASPPSGLALAGTTWQSVNEGAADMTFEFLDAGRLTYERANGPKHTDGPWVQAGDRVVVEVNDCYADYDGRIAGDTIVGEFSNEDGLRRPWTARRVERAIQGKGGR